MCIIISQEIRYNITTKYSFGFTDLSTKILKTKDSELKYHNF